MRNVVLAAAIFLPLVPNIAASQEAPAPFSTIPYEAAADETLFARWSGDFADLGSKGIAQLSAEDGVAENAARSEGAFIKYEKVGDDQAAWISIKFGKYNLGNSSLIQVRGIEGDEPQSQWFDQENLDAWEGRTALFNGSFLEVFLFASADDPDADYSIESVDLGQIAAEKVEDPISFQQQAIPEIEAICADDDRAASSDQRLGRIMPVGCTGWTIEGDKFLTAGHCAAGDRMKFLQFEVPISHPDGTPRHPNTEKQYHVIADSVIFANEGIGNDWAVFRVAPALGQVPPQDRYGYFRVRRDNSAGDVIVRGYGLDDDPAGPPPELRNEQSQTQQEHTGGLVSVVKNSNSNAVIKHQVDTRGGNSGSPIFRADEPEVAIGIHSHGGCNNSSFSSNHGTSFMNDDLWQAVQQ